MKDLLVYAKNQLKEEYISSIHGKGDKNTISMIFQDVENVDDYSLVEWSDAISYVLGEEDDILFKSNQELHELLKR